jgi:hypothetical protein
MSKSVISVIKEVIFNQRVTSEQIQAIFPSNFNQQLKLVVAAICTDHVSEWTESTLENHLSLPKFKNLEWEFFVIIIFIYVFFK